jgi:DNA polymerase epsilon subunit 3
VIVRLAKSVLPDNTMIQKEAVTALVKSATVFVNYLAATYFLSQTGRLLIWNRANDVTQQKGKKTINNEEILAALDIVELNWMVPHLQKHIERGCPVAVFQLIIEFEVVRREKRKKAEQDEDGRKKRKVEGELADEIAVETNGDDGDTEIEKATEDGETGDERDEHEEEHDEEDEVEGEIEAEEESHIVDMERDEQNSDGEETDEALAEDSD